MRYVSSIIKYFRNFIRYIRFGGVVYVNVSPIQYGECLKGRTALVVGGSSGFGLAIAKKYLFEGANVIITGRNKAKIETAEQILKEKYPQQIDSMCWDISDVTQVEKNVYEASLKFGKIDIFVNNAGVWKSNRFLQTEQHDWDHILNINLKGLYFIMQAEAKYMILNKIQGKIINTTSVEGIRTDFTPYSASKWGANDLTIGVAKKLVGNGIIVNAIAPGVALTDINIKLKEKCGNNEYWPGHPSGRFTHVEEIANLALFLASDSANNIVGQVIAVDGGWTLR